MSEAKVKGAKVLVVEDDEVLRGVLTRVLSGAGFLVDVACEGREGLERLERGAPDLVVTDIIMDGMEGVEMITAIRKTHPDQKIIAMSGGGRLAPADRLKIASRMGANGALAKPFTGEELLAMVAKVMKT